MNNRIRTAITSTENIEKSVDSTKQTDSVFVILHRVCHACDMQHPAAAVRPAADMAGLSDDAATLAVSILLPFCLA